jgi:5'(3')-deoxyribonucleotidase
MKKRLFIDMDGVLVDLKGEINKFSEMMPGLVNRYGADIDKIPGLFKDPRPVNGAADAFNRLSEVFDVYILSTAPWDNPDAWTHKRLWVEKHLGKAAYKRLILSHHKNLCQGDYLIDDRTANGAGEFNGELIQFGSTEFPNWQAVLTYLNA